MSIALSERKRRRTRETKKGGRRRQYRLVLTSTYRSKHGLVHGLGPGFKTLLGALFLILMISCMLLVYIVKLNIDGFIALFKARVMGKGFIQTYEVDYFKTCHVAGLNTICIISFHLLLTTRNK